jgi:hypothetical protein
MSGMRILTTTAALIVAAEGVAGDDKVGPPVGVYLWHPDRGGNGTTNWRLALLRLDLPTCIIAGGSRGGPSH